MTDRFLAAVVIAFCALSSGAQNRYEPIAPLPLGTTLLTLPSNHVADAHRYDVAFLHRFTQSADDGDALHSLFGLDGGANVAFGVAWTPMRDLELSLMRTNTLDDIEVGAKYVVMQQAAAIPVTLAARAGADWRTERGLTDRLSWFAQAIASRRLGRRVEIFALPTFVTDAGRATAGSQSTALFSTAANVPVAVAVLVAPNVTLIGEVVPSNRDLPRASRSDTGWAAGVEHALGGHHFVLMLSNSPAITVDEYTSSTFLGSPLRSGDLHIGFNIRRQFGGRRTD